MRSLFFLVGLMFISISLYSQTNKTHYAGNKNDLHYRNGRNYGGMAVFTVVGGVGCMLAPGVQFNSSIGVSTYGSTSDILFLSAGVILIGIGVAMLIANQRTEKRMSGKSPTLKYETFNNLNSRSKTSRGFPAIGINIPIK